MFFFFLQNLILKYCTIIELKKTNTEKHQARNTIKINLILKCLVLVKN